MPSFQKKYKVLNSLRNLLSLGVFLLAVILPQWVLANDPAFNIFFAMDAGRLEKGSHLEAGAAQRNIEGMTLVRNYFNLSYTEQLDERNLISMGVGGLFFKPYEKEWEASGDRTLRFGPGLSHMLMQYKFNDNMKLNYGFIEYKYNKSAKNLGEYLFRSEAYPATIYTGGWVWLNAASYKAVGAQYNWSLADGAFNQDFLLFMEMFNSPVYDITPAYVASFKMGDIFTLGGGVAFHRFITPTPGTRDDLTETVVYVENVPVTPTADHPDPVFTGLREDLAKLDPLKWQDSLTYVPQSIALDNRAIKLMGFFDLDLRAMMGQDPESFPEFNFYGEVSLLGLKNYPVFYQSYGERLVSMLGFSIPIPHVFDNFSAEIEYFPNSTVESIRSTHDKLNLAPDLYDPVFLPENPGYRYAKFDQDDIKWTVHGSRKINSIFTLYFQLANDHFRPKNAFAQPLFIPATNDKSHWYWLVRFQWAL